MGEHPDVPIVQFRHAELVIAGIASMPSADPRSRSVAMFRSINTHRFTLLLLIVTFVLIPAGPTTAQLGTDYPILTSVVPLSGTPGQLLVTGDHFTPGGNVLIVVRDRGADFSVAIQDPEAQPAYETRWTTASATTFDMLGHDDPALGFRMGGTVRVEFGYLCDQPLIVRAYDQEAGRWSNDLGPDAGCSG
jgi:hypothetical protein